MAPEMDIWRTAPLLIRQHGEDAEIVAPQRLGIYAIWYDGYRVGLPPNCTIQPDEIIHSLPELLR